MELYILDKYAIPKDIPKNEITKNLNTFSPYLIKEDKNTISAYFKTVKAFHNQYLHFC